MKVGCKYNVVFKGYYAVHNFNIDDQKLPPFLPAGRYKIQAAILFNGYIMLKASVYVEIIYKVKQYVYNRSFASN